MKSRSVLLLENSIHAAIAAIEVYNKPSFLYREEIFSILMINAWELCLKAKYLQLHHNRLQSLFVPLTKKKKDGTEYKTKRYKTNRSGNYLTLEIAYLIEHIPLDKVLKNHLETLLEIRDNAIHFLNNPVSLKKVFLEVAAASLKGYSVFVESEFKFSLKEYDFSILPISFNLSDIIEPASLQKESVEIKKLLAYLINKRTEGISSEKYDVALNINLKFSRSKETGIKVRLDKEGIPIFQETEEMLKNRFPLDYGKLTEKLKSVYVDIKFNSKFYKIKKNLEANPKYAKVRLLDFDNPKSQKKVYYNPSIIDAFGEYYKKR